MNFYTIGGRLCRRSTIEDPATTAKYYENDREKIIPFRDEIEPTTVDNNKFNNIEAEKINLRNKPPEKTNHPDTIGGTTIKGAAITLITIMLLLVAYLVPALVKNSAMKNHIPVQMSKSLKSSTQVRPVQVKIKFSDSADAGDIIKVRKGVEK